MKLTEVKAEDIKKNKEKYDRKEFLMTYKDCFGTMTSTVIKFYLNYKGVLYFYFADEGIFSCDKEDIRFDDRGVWKDAKFYLIEYDDD